jgi:hypothetical protein
MEIEFYGKYDKADFYQAVALVNKPSRRSTIIRIGIVVILTALYAIYFVSMATKENLSTFDVARAGRHVISIGIILYFLLQPYISAYQAATKLWKIPAVQAPFGGFVSSQGITYNLANGRKERLWDQFAKIQKNDKFIALLTPDGALSLLPRSFFKNENDWKIVQQWANYKVIEAV